MMEIRKGLAFMVKYGTTNHGINHEQRFVGLDEDSAPYKHDHGVAGAAPQM